MKSTLLQDWVTAHGNAMSGSASITQTQDGWLDVSSFAAATFWIDVSEVLVPGTGVNVVLTLQTSPTLDESYFQPVAAPINPLQGNTTPLIVQTVRAPGMAPLARYLRWQLTVTSNSINATWGATFRIRVALSPQSSFVPKDIGGCLLWLRADLGVTLNSDGFPTGWADQSGHGNTATAVGNWTYSPSGAAGGGQAYLSPIISGNAAYMYGSINPGGPTVNTLACVCSWKSGSSQVYIGPCSTNQSHAVNTGAAFVYEGSGAVGFYASQQTSAGLRNAKYSVALDGLVHAHVGTSGSVISTYYRDGVSVGTASLTGTPNTPTDYVVGAIDNTTTYTWWGNIYEVLLFNGILAGNDLARLNNYLMGRYAITT